MYAVSAAQMRAIDALTIAGGVAETELMEQAAAAVERRIVEGWPGACARGIGVLCGGGNNGGDGLVLTRRLRQRGLAARAWLLAPPERLRGGAAAALGALRELHEAPTTVTSAEAWGEQRGAVLASAMIVDALLGTGLVRPLEGWLRAVVGEINQHYRGPVVAVDLPTGLNADGVGPAEAAGGAVLRAAATVTFTAPKLGLYFSRHADCAGALEVAAIGSPPALVAEVAAAGGGVRVCAAADCAPFVAPRPVDSHKGRYGHVLVIAGSLGKSGAAVLASTAALRAGAGLVTAAVPRSVLPVVAAAQPELMTEPLPETPGGALGRLDPAHLASLLAPATVVAVGPGLSQAPETATTVRALVAGLTLPCVLDADGLNAFHHRRAELRLASGVLTPHPGEMARLFDTSTADVQSRRPYFVQRLAAETGAIAVLKGHNSLIADPSGALVINPVDSPGMATAGSGDVLTGIIAGLLAQHPQAARLEVVACAVYLHGLAGVIAAGREGEMGMIASDIIAALPEAVRRVQQP
ncbi:MAG: NAD(P)H-hydrate dehydratase [Terriglobales bacterium]